MAARSVSFDDPDDEALFVFSGGDLLTSHYDQSDLDWREVAERSALDERRGLVITQLTVLEDLIDELILFVEDLPDRVAAGLDGKMIGRRLTRLERAFDESGLSDDASITLLAETRAVVDRRNLLAHGTIHCRPVGGPVSLPIVDELDLEWVITDRRTSATSRLTMRQLRDDLNEAIGVFSSWLLFAESLVERAPSPKNFPGGYYLGAS
jgi:hypothetical protein